MRYNYTAEDMLNFKERKNADDVTPKENAQLNKFNWSAFCFGSIWAFLLKKYYIIAIYIAIASINLTHTKMGYFIETVLTLLLNFYIGTQGNRWAWEKTYKKYVLFNDFIHTQRIYTTISIVLYVISYSILFYLKFFK